jgi:hypothetical protein
LILNHRSAGLFRDLYLLREFRRHDDNSSSSSFSLYSLNVMCVFFTREEEEEKKSDVLTKFFEIIFSSKFSLKKKLLFLPQK